MAVVDVVARQRNALLADHSTILLRHTEVGTEGSAEIISVAVFNIVAGRYGQNLIGYNKCRVVVHTSVGINGDVLSHNEATAVVQGIRRQGNITFFRAEDADVVGDIAANRRAHAGTACNTAVVVTQGGRFSNHFAVGVKLARVVINSAGAFQGDIAIRRHLPTVVVDAVRCNLHALLGNNA